MNSSSIILGAIVIIPLIVLMVLRINAALVFLSLCLGDVLIQFVAGDTNYFISFLSSNSVSQSLPSANDHIIKIGLLLLPVILTSIFMIHTVKGIRLILNILPAAGVGLLGGLLTVPLLTSSLSKSIVSSSLWVQATRAEDLIVGASALICLLAIWLQRPKSGHTDKHAKHS